MTEEEICEVDLKETFFERGKEKQAKPGPVHRSSSSTQLFRDTDAFNPFVFLQNYPKTLRAGGASILFVIENNSGGGRLDPSGFGAGAAVRLGSPAL
ncbi:hypothetical protein HS088_TW06G01453 [Tripterygium wilfordii]|uniref:Uncharacterized protein n=1 Tax=Tripterygium wilfordii TaxID=458696 RepID=A0A7J7DLM3_TRIWF|nr:hypothetical protein HS088_TW06G01453 [Tripterygium wilfordii]